METNKFKNRDNSLTYYAFACGYIQRKVTDNIYKEIYMEHNHFHVKSGIIDRTYTTWEVFHSNELTKAKKLYNSI